MNPITWTLRQISNIFKFFYDDFKTDIIAIYKILKGIKDEKSIFKQEFKDGFINYFKYFDISDFLKEYWLAFVFFVLVYVAGWWLGSQYYQSECNRFIYNEYILPQAKTLNISSIIFR